MLRLVPALLFLSLLFATPAAAGERAAETVEELRDAVDRLAVQGVDVSELRRKLETLEGQVRSEARGAPAARSAAAADDGGGVWGMVRWIASKGKSLVDWARGKSGEPSGKGNPFAGFDPSSLDPSKADPKSLRDAFERFRKVLEHMKSRGYDTTALEQELAAAEPELRGAEGLFRRADEERKANGHVSEATQHELEAFAKTMEPRMHRVAAEIKKLSMQALTDFRKHFSEEDAERLKGGMEKMQGMLEGLGAQLREAAPER